MQIRPCVIALCCVLGILVSGPALGAPFKATLTSGSSFAASDIDNDGIPGILNIGQGHTEREPGRGGRGGPWSRFKGPFTMHMLIEYAPGASGLCAPGEVENVFLAGTVILRDRLGDALYWVIKAATFCATAILPGATYTFDSEQAVTGGTGQFAGATVPASRRARTARRWGTCCSSRRRSSRRGRCRSRHRCRHRSSTTRARWRAGAAGTNRPASRTRRESRSTRRRRHRSGTRPAPRSSAPFRRVRSSRSRRPDRSRSGSCAPRRRFAMYFFE